MSGSGTLGFARRWWWLLVLGLIVSAVSTYFVSDQLPKVYEARATLLVGAAAGNELISSLTADQLTATYAELVTTQPIRASVAAVTGVPADQIARSLDAVPVRDTHFIQLRFRSTDPSLAAQTINQLAAIAIQQLQAARAERGAARVDRVRAVVDQFAQDVADRQQQVRALQGTAASPQRDVQLNVAQADLTRTQQRYTAALGALDDARLAQAGAGDVLTLTEPAALPTVPVLPRTPENVFSAAVVGLLVALLVGLALDRMRDRRGTLADLAGALDVTTYGGVPLLTASPIKGGADAFRDLRNALRARLGEPPHGIVLVTSAVQGEGTTTVVAGLATAFARSGERVIVVDANLRRPRLSTLFGVAVSGGLTDLLTDRARHASGQLQATSVPNLGLVAAGPIATNSVDVEASDRMRQVLRELSGEADLVIVDAASLEVTDPLALLAAAADVVLVLDPRMTGQRVAAHAATEISANGGRILALVANRGV